MLETPLTPTIQCEQQMEVRRLPLAYVLLNTEIGAEREVLTTIRKTEGVQEAFNLMGIYDIIARVKADSMDGLKKIINEKLQVNKVNSKLTIVITDQTT
jgi:DNA-binding Lrp family transcriptional regulator